MTRTPIHWHAFAYTNHGYTDREAALAPMNYPPVELARWMDRRPGLRVYRENEIEEAVGWLGDELNKYPPLDAASYPIGARLEASRARLNERVNRSVWYGYWSGSRFITRTLIECTGTDRRTGCAP